MMLTRMNHTCKLPSTIILMKDNRRLPSPPARSRPRSLTLLKETGLFCALYGFSWNDPWHEEVPLESSYSVALLSITSLTRHRMINVVLDSRATIDVLCNPFGCAAEGSVAAAMYLCCLAVATTNWGLPQLQ